MQVLPEKIQLAANNYLKISMNKWKNCLISEYNNETLVADLKLEISSLILDI